MNYLHYNISKLLKKLHYPFLQSAFFMAYLIQNTSLFSYHKKLRGKYDSRAKTYGYALDSKKSGVLNTLDGCIHYRNHSYLGFQDGYPWFDVHSVFETAPKSIEKKKLRLIEKNLEENNFISDPLIAVQFSLLQLTIPNLYQPCSQLPKY